MPFVSHLDLSWRACRFHSRGSIHDIAEPLVPHVLGPDDTRHQRAGVEADLDLQNKRNARERNVWFGGSGVRGWVEQI